MIEYSLIVGIILAAFVSEDLTCISTGLLIRSGKMTLETGLLGCFAGIFLGDLGLFFLGRAMGYGIFRFKSLRQRISGSLEKIAKRFEREGWKLIVLARFVPGLRFPVYLGAGFLGGKTRTMAVFALLAGLVWTPLLVFLSIWLGPSLQSSLEMLTGSHWLGLGFTAVIFYILLRFFLLLFTNEGRRRWFIRLKKMTSPEFWPPWLFYAPLLPGWIYWSIRYKGFHTITAANPSIEGGGIIGESKAAILKKLPPQWCIDWLLVPAASSLDNSIDNSLDNSIDNSLDNKKKSRSALLQQRWNYLQKKGFKEKRWTYPLIFKPDQGQRGVGVRLIHTSDQAKNYLAQNLQEILVQVYHPGPFEAGIFYYRKPREKQGHIFSITDKVFPVLEGDGKSDLEALIKKHPRYAMQAKTFLRRISRNGEDLKRILKKKERFPLAVAGNHVQGTMFCDGAGLYSEALRKTIDGIAKKIPSFYFGRFDVRCPSRKELQSGKGFLIIELNGGSSESTNVYDPQWNIFQIYKILYQQWSLLFEIGHENRKNKMPYLSLGELLRTVWRYLKTQKSLKLSD